MSDDAKPEDVSWIHCNNCGRDTRSELVAHRVLREQEDIPEHQLLIDWTTTFDLFECRGCGSMVLRRRVVSHSIDVDEYAYFPPPMSRRPPNWKHDLPPEISSLLDECYGAIQADSRRLALMGARTLIDGFMNLTVGAEGSFRQRLDRMVEAGYLGQRQRETLEICVDAGSAAAHRGYLASRGDLDLVFDITEVLLHSLVAAEKAKELAARTPPRR